jgi:uncharacterized cupin superfamily protein
MTVPSREVIDLRPYAAAARPTGDWLSGRSEPAFVDSGATVTALAPVGTGKVAALPAHEFLLVVAGELVIEATAGTQRVAAGRSAVLPAGLAFAWSAAAGTVVLVVASMGAPASTPTPAPTTGQAHAATMIDEAAPLTPSNPPLAELLVGPTPSCRNHTDFLAGEFVCGTWDSTPYHRRTMPYRHIELMHLLEGSVTLEGAAGSATFGVGDIFLVTRGAERAWISTVHVKKVYAIHRPA